MRLIPLRARAILPLVAVSVLVLAACRQAGSGSTEPSSAGAVDLAVSETDAGDALGGAGGMTLYILTEDQDGSSTCTEGCADTWPPLLGDGSQVSAGPGISGTFGTTTRPDGSKQVTHNGQPLYYYTGDSAPGDSTGDGVYGVWFIAPVGGSAQTQGSSNPSASPYRQPAY